MAGLLSTSGSGIAPVGFTPEDDLEQEAQPNVSPEEQKQYDMFVENGMKILYKEDGTVQPEVLRRLSTGNKPIDTLAQTGVWLVAMVESSAQKNGFTVTNDVLLHAGRELFEQLADIDQAAGIHDFKEAELQGAWYQALDMYREVNTGGRFDKDEATAAFEALNEADKEGRADEVVPGFYQTVEKGMAMAMADGAPVQEEDIVDGEKKLLNRSRGLL